MKKKIILGVSLFLMLLTLFALSITAQTPVAAWDISATSNDSVIAQLYPDTENEGYYTLTIKGSGKMKDYYGTPEAPWRKGYGSKIISLTVENGVENIGSQAFYYDCRALKTVVLADSVTSIGDTAFSGCKALTSVVGKNVTSVRSNAFSGCALTDFNFKALASIGEYAFSYCDFERVILSEKVSIISSSAFYCCSKMQSIYIPSTVTYIKGNAFLECSSNLTIYTEKTSAPYTWTSGWNKTSNNPIEYASVKYGFSLSNKMADIITFKGYSFNEAGSMAAGFDIDYEAKALYEELTGETLSIGVVFASLDLLGGQNPIDKDGKPISLDVGKIAQRDLTKLDYAYYDFVVSGISDDLKDYSIVIAAYIYNGAEVKYIQSNGISDTVTGVAYNEAKGGQL